MLLSAVPIEQALRRTTAAPLLAPTFMLRIPNVGTRCRTAVGHPRPFAAMTPATPCCIPAASPLQSHAAVLPRSAAPATSCVPAVLPRPATVRQNAGRARAAASAKPATVQPRNATASQQHCASMRQPAGTQAASGAAARSWRSPAGAAAAGAAAAGASTGVATAGAAMFSGCTLNPCGKAAGTSSRVGRTLPKQHAAAAAC